MVGGPGYPRIFHKVKQRRENDAQVTEGYGDGGDLCLYYVYRDGRRLYPRITRVYDLLQDILSAAICLGLDENRDRCFSAD